MGSSMFNAQITKLGHNSTNWLAALNLYYYKAKKRREGRHVATTNMEGGIY